MNEKDLLLGLDYFNTSYMELFSRIAYIQEVLEWTDPVLVRAYNLIRRAQGLPEYEPTAADDGDPEASEPEDLSVHSSEKRGPGSGEPDIAAKKRLPTNRRRPKKPAATEADGQAVSSGEAENTPKKRKQKRRPQQKPAAMEADGQAVSSGVAEKTPMKRKQNRRRQQKQAADQSADTKEPDSTDKKRKPRRPKKLAQAIDLSVDPMPAPDAVSGKPDEPNPGSGCPTNQSQTEIEPSMEILKEPVPEETIVTPPN